MTVRNLVGVMADSADLVCLDHLIGLALGSFWNTASPRYLFTPDGSPASRSPTLSRALWRMIAEHAGHHVRLLGEQSPEWDDLDIDTLVTVGGDRTLGHDPAIAEYAAGVPDGHAFVVCGTDRTALRVGPGPDWEQRNHAAWRMLADHVYHDVSVATGAVDRLWPGYTVVGVDVAVPDFVAEWPG